MALSSLIRPGIMVSLKNTVIGGVRYTRVDLNAPVQSEDQGTQAPAILNENEEAVKAHISRWETTRTIEDLDEYERASKVRLAAVGLIKKVCSDTVFGLLCPEKLEPVLDSAIKEARRMAEEHNNTAKFTRVHIYALKGRIASSDEEAARAIGEEVRQLIEGMNSSIDRLDPEAIRDAAKRASQIAEMLNPEQATKVSLAIEAARKAARTIVARVEKKAENASVVLKDIQRGAIEQARMMFLDLDETPAAPELKDQLPAVDARRFDLDIGD